jgi:hypothetical protein
MLKLCSYSILPYHLAEHNRVHLIWVPDHEGIVGNETADQLARTGPGPTCDILVGVAKEAGRDCTDRNHKKYWESTTGLTNRQRDLYQDPLPDERRIC